MNRTDAPAPAAADSRALAYTCEVCGTPAADALPCTFCADFRASAADDLDDDLAPAPAPTLAAHLATAPRPTSAAYPTPDASDLTAHDMRAFTVAFREHHEHVMEEASDLRWVEDPYLGILDLDYYGHRIAVTRRERWVICVDGTPVADLHRLCSPDTAAAVTSDLTGEL